MSTVRKLGAVLCLLLASLSVAAGSFDGSTPLVCVMVEAIECDPDRNCTKGPPWEVDLPIFMEIDFKKKTVTSIDALDKGRSSEVLAAKKLDGLITMVGSEGAYAWSLAVTEDTGMMSLTLSGREHGFVILGACNPK